MTKEDMERLVEDPSGFFKKFISESHDANTGMAEVATHHSQQIVKGLEAVTADYHKASAAYALWNQLAARVVVVLMAVQESASLDEDLKKAVKMALDTALEHSVLQVVISGMPTDAADRMTTHVVQAIMRGEMP